MASITSLKLAIRTRLSKQNREVLKKKAAFEIAKVYLRFSVNGDMQYVPTGEYVDTETWDAKAGCVLTPPRLSTNEMDKRRAINKTLLLRTTYLIYYFNHVFYLNYVISAGYPSHLDWVEIKDYTKKISGNST